MRLFLQRTALLSFLLAAVCDAGWAQQRITWAEFSTKATPVNKIRMVLPDGTHVEGYTLTAKPDGLDFNVTRTSNRQAHPKGKATIPRASVSAVDMRPPRWKGRLIGTLVPIAAGVAMFAAASGAEEGPFYGYVIAGGLALGAGTPAGFLMGWAVDRRFYQFIIIPEPPGAK